ncbi:MAG: STAS domain-containing protein [Sarcina sp.]
MDGLEEIKTEETEVLILRLKNINNIDATVINQIKIIYERSLKDNIKLILSGLKKEDRELFENKGYISYENINDALEKAKDLIK